MQRGRGGMGGFFGSGFGDPFAGFGRPGNLISSVFGGRDPFDDPFFTRPFGSMFGLDMFGASPLGSLASSPFGLLEDVGNLVEEQPPPPKKSRGPIIREITSDGEEEEAEEEEEGEKGKEEGSRKRSRSSKETYHPETREEIGKRRLLPYVNNSSSSSHGHRPQAHTYAFQTTKVTYGGPNGAYYSSSTTRKSGGGGVIFEESKEADTTTGKATHRVSRGLHEKGHSVTRRLNADGRVEMMQTLHNLNQDELPGFENEWKGNAKKHIPGWNRSLDMLENVGQSSRGSGGRSARHAWALPSTVQQHQYYPEKTTGVPPRAYPTNPSNKSMSGSF